MVQAVFVIPPKVHLLDITGPAHLFYEALDYGADVKLLFSNLSVNQAEVESSSNLFLSHLADFSAIELCAGDIIFVPGIESALLVDPDFLNSTRPFQYWLKKQHQSGVVICSVCTGAFLLAEAGLLDGRECTTHWKYVDRFTKRFPKTHILQNRLFVKSGHVYTSAGVASGIDLALFIIEEKWGSYFATRIAKEVVVYLRRSESDPQLSVFMQYRNHMDNRVHVVQDILTHSLDQKHDIDALAQKVHMSSRNLTRLFKKTTHITIGQYHEKLRLGLARQLIGEGHTIQAVAISCGLKSTNQLRNLLKKHQEVQLSSNSSPMP